MENEKLPPPSVAEEAKRLLALVELWRAKAAHVRTYHTTMHIGWDVCANELEEALLAERETRGQGWQPIESLREALEECLTFEKAAAELCGFSDCTCMSHSRNTERLYETGRCPHQLARIALAKLAEVTDVK